MTATCGATLESNGFTFACNKPPHKHGKHRETLPYRPTEGHPDPYIETVWTDEDMTS